MDFFFQPGDVFAMPLALSRHFLVQTVDSIILTIDITILLDVLIARNQHHDQIPIQRIINSVFSEGKLKSCKIKIINILLEQGWMQVSCSGKIQEEMTHRNNNS